VRCFTVVWLDLQQQIASTGQIRYAGDQKCTFGKCVSFISPSCFFIGNCQPIKVGVLLLTFSPDWLIDWLISGLNRFNFAGYLWLFTYKTNQNLNGNLPLILIKFLHSRCNGYSADSVLQPRFSRSSSLKDEFDTAHCLWYNLYMRGISSVSCIPICKCCSLHWLLCIETEVSMYWNEDIWISSRLGI
jgi:hypothetical protein